MRYRIAKINDMDEIANVHICCFPNYFTSTFGNELLSAYYLEFLKEEPLFVVAEDNNRIVGFCMGYRRGKSIAKQSFISKNKYKLFFRMLFLCMTFNKIAIKKCFQFIIGKVIKSEKQLCPISAEGDLLSICVNKEYRGLGVSDKLINQFESTLKAQGIDSYLLSVYKTNISARSFYEKNGLLPVFESEDEMKYYKSI